MPFQPPPPVEDRPGAGVPRFTPPPPVEDKPEAPGALSRFGTGLYQSTIQPMADTLAHPINAVKGLAGLSGVPQAYNAATHGDYGGAARELMTGPAQRIASSTIQPIAEDAKQGNYAGAAGRTVGSVASLATPLIGESEGVSRGLGALKAGASAAGPDMAAGAGKMGAGVGLGTALHGTGIPGAHYAGVYPVFAGGRQMISGFGKGMEAAQDALHPTRLEPMPPSPVVPQTFGPAGKPSAGGPPPVPVVPIRGGLPSGRRVGGLAPPPGSSPAEPPPLPLATPSTARGLSIAEQLRDAMGESSPEARMNPEGQLQFGGEHPEMDEIANDDANFKRFMDNSKAKPEPVLGRQIRMRRRS